MCVKNAMLEELITLEVPLPSARRQLSPLPSRRIINPSFKARRGERGDQAPPGTARNARALRTHAPTRHARPPADAHPRTRTPRTRYARTSPVLLATHCHPPPHSPPREHVSQKLGRRIGADGDPRVGAAPQGKGLRGGIGPGPPARRCPAPRPGRGESRTSRLLPVHLMEEEGCGIVNPLGAGASRVAALLPSAQKEIIPF